MSPDVLLPRLCKGHCLSPSSSLLLEGKSILNHMWACQQGCCGHRSSLSSAGSWLSRPCSRWVCCHTGECHSPGTDRSCHKPLQLCFSRPALIPARALGSAGHRAGACPCPCGFPCPCSPQLPRARHGLGVFAGLEGWSCEKCFSLPRSCDNAHPSLVLLSALHRSLQEKKALLKRGLWHLGTASASGRVGRSLGKGLLPPFSQHLSQTQSPSAFTPAEGWDAPARWAGVLHAHSRAQTEPRVWLRTAGGQAWPWAEPSPLCSLPH